MRSEEEIREKFEELINKKWSGKYEFERQNAKIKILGWVLEDESDKSSTEVIKEFRDKR